MMDLELELRQARRREQVKQSALAQTILAAPILALAGAAWLLTKAVGTLKDLVSTKGPRGDCP